MSFDGPYPTHSGSMARIIYDALLSPNYHEVDDIVLSPTTSIQSEIEKRSLRFPGHFRTWIKSSPFLRRIRSFKQTDTPSLTPSSSLSLASLTANDILHQVPEKISSTAKLVQAMQDMDKCFPKAPSNTDSETPTETTSEARSESMGRYFGIGRDVSVNLEMQRRNVVANVGQKNDTKRVKRRYVEINNGIWDTIYGTFIPNAWPLQKMKTRVKRKRCPVEP